MSRGENKATGNRFPVFRSRSRAYAAAPTRLCAAAIAAMGPRARRESRGKVFYTTLGLARERGHALLLISALAQPARSLAYTYIYTYTLCAPCVRRVSFPPPLWVTYMLCPPKSIIAYSIQTVFSFTRA